MDRMAEPAMETLMPATVMTPKMASAKVAAAMPEVMPWITTLKLMVTKPAVTTKVTVVPAVVATGMTPVVAPVVTAENVMAVAEIMLAKLPELCMMAAPLRSLR